jgi:hypothetical protein
LKNTSVAEVILILLLIKDSLNVLENIKKYFPNKFKTKYDLAIETLVQMAGEKKKEEIYLRIITF